MVVFLSPHSDPEANLGEQDAGGQCVYQHSLAQALVQIEGVAVRTYTRHTGARPAISTYGNYSIHRLESGGLDFVPKEHIEMYLNDFARQITRHLPLTTPLVLHGHYWDGGKTSLLLKTFMKKPVSMVWTPHSLGAIKRQKFKGENNENIYNFIPRIVWENYTIYAADRIIVSTPKEKNLLMREYSLLKNKISIIPPGTELSQFHPVGQSKARKKFNLPSQGKMLLCMGRISRSKGYHLALHVLHQLAATNQKNIFLVICGGSPQSTDQIEKAYLQELTHLTLTLGLEKKVIFHPAISHEEVNYMYQAADIVLLPSEHEPFGLTVLEAMAAGTPVVAQNLGGPTQIIAHNQTGILVNFHAPQKTATEIANLINNPGLAQTLAQSAQSSVRREYSWQNKARKFYSVYRQVLSNANHSFNQRLKNNYFLRHNLGL